MYDDSYNSYGGDPDAAVATMMGMVGVIALIGLAVTIFQIFLFWRIFSKAGYSGALSLLMLVPIANFVLIIWFAFAEWPVQRQAKLAVGGASPLVT
jgi:uncharacterized membrane protein YhaH (DUF805 family)